MKQTKIFSRIRRRIRCGGIVAVAWLALAALEADAQITYYPPDYRWVEVGYETNIYIGISTVASDFASDLLPFHREVSCNSLKYGASGHATHDSVLTSNSIVFSASGSCSAWIGSEGYPGDCRAQSYIDVTFSLDQYCRFTLSGNGSGNVSSTQYPVTGGGSAAVSGAQYYWDLYGRQMGQFYASFVGDALESRSVEGPLSDSCFDGNVTTNGFLDAGNYFLSGGFGVGGGVIGQTGLMTANAQGSGSMSLSFTVEPMGTRLVGLEVIQTIQDWNNSVPLIAGKPTYVRAHVEPISAPSVPIMNPRLRGYVGGSELPDSPLTNMANSATTALPNAADSDRRANLQGSVNFKLPPSWTTNSIRLEMEMDGLVSGDASLVRYANFDASPQLDLRIVKVSVADSTTVISSPPTDDAIKQEATRLAELYPLTREAIHMSELSMVISGPDQLSAEEFLEQIKLKRLEEGQSAIYVAAASGTLAGNLAGISDNIPGNILVARINQSGTLAHELGHVLGEFHTVNAQLFGTVIPLDPDPVFLPETNYAAGPTCGRYTLAAPLSRAVNFPFWFVTTALIGPYTAESQDVVYGLANGYQPAAIRVISPYKSQDLMENGYCVNYENWISTFTYGRLRSALLARTSAAPLFASRSIQQYVVIRGLVDFGSNTVTLLPFVSLSLSSPPVAPTGNTHLLNVYLRNGATTNLAYSIPFTPDTPKGDASAAGPAKGFFTIPVAGAIANLVRVEILRNQTVLASRSRSAAAPVIQLLSPNGGEVLGSSPLVAHWNASDADGDALTYQIQFSPDGGQSWQMLAVDWPTNSFPLSGDSLPGSTDALLKVVASDGVNTSASQSALPFTIVSHALQVTTTSLSDGTNGAFYSQPVNAYGGQPPYNWSLTPGSVPLPPGLNLSSDGTLSGTPTNSDTFYFFVRVTDALSDTADGFLSIYIPTPVQIPALSLTALNFTGNQFQLRLTGATGQNYTVQTSTNLSSTNWISLFITNNATTNSFIVTDPNATNQQRFYRILIGQ